MSFSVHTFETNPSGKEASFAFHEKLGEGQEIFFLGKFDEATHDAKTFAESVFGCIVDSFQNPSMKDVYDIFEDGLKTANIEIQKRKHQLPKTPEIVVALFDFHNLYLSQIGEAEVYLIRGTNLSQITEMPNAGELSFSNILSGQVAVRDSIIMGSSRILRILTSKQLIDIFDENSFSEGVSLLKHELTIGTDESILVTIIGIAKQKESVMSAGFLSRTVAKKLENSKKSLNSLTEKLTNLGAKKKKSVQETAVQESKEWQEEPEYQKEKNKKYFEEESKNNFEEPANTRPRKQKKAMPNINWSQMWSKIGAIKNIKQNPKQKSITFALVGIGILILGYSGLKAIGSNPFSGQKELREKIALAQESLKQAETYLFQGERKSAGEILAKAEENLKYILNEGRKEVRDEARIIMAEVQGKKLEVENAKRMTAQLLADLGVKFNNFEATEINNLNGNLFVNDRKQVVKTIRNIVDKETQIVTRETIIASDTRTDQNTILFLTDTPQVIEFRDGGVTPMSTEDQTWKKGIDIKTYGQFIYILDPIENQIWKYKRNRTKYSSVSPYNLGTTNMSRGVSMAIDGRIYVLSDNGSIQKFFRGNPEKYEFRDLPSIPFSGKNLRLFTGPEHEFLYVLDPNNTRILIFSKGETGATYRKQIIFDLPQGEIAKDFTININGQKVNIITQTKIYEFSL